MDHRLAFFIGDDKFGTASMATAGAVYSRRRYCCIPLSSTAFLRLNPSLVFVCPSFRNEDDVRNVDLWFVFTRHFCLVTAFVTEYVSVASATLQAGRSRVRFLMRSLDFSIYLNLAPALWPWGRLRNEYQESSWW
jgi:hypothetical protein